MTQLTKMEDLCESSVTQLFFIRGLRNCIMMTSLRLIHFTLAALSGLKQWEKQRRRRCRRGIWVGSWPRRNHRAAAGERRPQPRSTRRAAPSPTVPAVRMRCAWLVSCGREITVPAACTAACCRGTREHACLKPASEQAGHDCGRMSTEV